MSGMYFKLAPLGCMLAFAFSPVGAQEHVHGQHDGHAVEAPDADPTSSSGHPAASEDAHKYRAGAASSTEPGAIDHAAMGHEAMGHEAMDHAAMGHEATDDVPASQTPLVPIPALSAADHEAAFPTLTTHAMHGDGIHSYWSMDRLETWDAEEAGTGVGWEALAWVGTDLDRLWIRSEGEGADDGIESADVEFLYGRSVSRWWDLVGGIRHDFGEGPSQTFAAIGVQGMAPYKFEIAATAYVGESGQTAARFEAEYDTLLTNRLILQWTAEAELHGKDDPARGVGSGLGTLEAGARLRYEVTRRFAPYLGVAWERTYGDTADYRRAEGETRDDTRLVLGVRLWF